MIHFTSDTHFGHAKIIEYCERPYTSVDSMDKNIIHKWNSVVSPTDEIYHLGDFCFGDAGVAIQYLRQLNGIIKFVLPNNHHDKWQHNIKFPRSGISICDNSIFNFKYHDELTEKLYYFSLCHFPFSSWNRMYYGAMHVHGHMHSGDPYADDNTGRKVDIGVDAWGFYPVSIDEVIKLLEPVTFGADKRSANSENY